MVPALAAVSIERSDIAQMREHVDNAIASDPDDCFVLKHFMFEGKRIKASCNHICQRWRRWSGRGWEASMPMIVDLDALTGVWVIWLPANAPVGLIAGLALKSCQEMNLEFLSLN